MRKIRATPFMFTLLLAAAVIATAAIRYSEPISDGDIWFHLAYGKYLLENKTLIPDHTVFSWTPSENSTIYSAWIPEIVFYLLHDAGGLNMLYALRYAFVLVFIICAFSLYRYPDTDQPLLPLVFLTCLAGLLMSCAGLRIKAELFSFFLMTIMVWAVFRIKTQPQQARYLVYLFPLLILVWINSHGGFIFGLVFLGLVLVGEILNAVSGSSTVIAPGMKKHIVISGILVCVALFLTPYGWEYPMQLLNSLVFQPQEFKGHMASIAEYQSIFFPQASHLHFVDYLIIASMILAGLMIAFWRRHAADWTLILVNASFLILYIKILRATYFWAVIFVFSSCYLIRIIEKDYRDVLAERRSRSAIVGISIIVLLLSVIRANYEALCAPSIVFKASYITPEHEAAFIKDHYQNPRMGNDYASGSYLIWSLWPQKKVFIDSRYFPYKQWYHEEGEFESYENKSRVEYLIKKYDCDLWCISWDTPVLKYFITSPDWRLECYGPSACVFLSRKIEKPKNIRSVASSVYTTDLYQRYTIAKYASMAGDIEVSQKIAKSMQPNRFSPQQIKFSVNAKLIVGSDLFSRGRYTDAIAVYTDALRTYEHKLIPDFIMAKELRTDIAMIHNNLGSSYMQLSRIGEASEEFSRALELEPGLDIARKNLPLVKSQLIKIDAAIEKLNKALRNDPHDVRVLNALAVSHSMRGHHDEALGYLMKELAVSPENPQTYYNIACIYSRQNKVKESVEYLEKAVAKGFKDWDLLKKDHDLDSIRNTDYFRRLIERH